MSSKSIVAVLALCLVSVSPALGSFSGGSKPEDSPSGSSTSTSTTPDGRTTTTNRQEAEHWYGDAYEDVAKAQKDVADGKKKNADKKFKRAMERGERAVGLDSTYHEAWNLVGFCARNLTLYDRSLDAYNRCLAIKPDYAPAREYLGEAYVELGRIKDARDQLVWLQRLNATADAQTLTARIDAWTAAHPDSSGTPAAPATAPATPAAPADTTSAGGTGGSGH